ncbi:MAG TPA: ABC transporter ATP-binding protein [Acidimicrobiia bacterium]|nr:ABC transporter ATP-binding protein [Acidimicrobiia bacterium]
MSGALRIDELSKTFSDVTAVDRVSLDLATGEHLALIGPSGCGKSTILLMIAGLLAPDGGEIRIGDRLCAGGGAWVEPDRRRVGMVFQDYALFPHLNVSANIAFGLDRHPKDYRRKRVDEVLGLVGLEALAGRYPHELSSGQQQRVALARSLAPDPAVVLLDEPFSNLDRTLRESLRVETKAVLRRAGATAVLVTHDHSEALGFGDRVAVMRGGHVLQIGSPEDLFDFPEDEFVATFLGSADFLPAARDSAGTVTSAVGPIGRLDLPAGGDLAVMVRPHEVTFEPDPAGPATIATAEYQGSTVVYEITLDSGQRLSCRRSPSPRYEPGTRVRIGLLEGYPPVLFHEGRRIWPAIRPRGDSQLESPRGGNTNGTYSTELERGGPGDGVARRRMW